MGQLLSFLLTATNFYSPQIRKNCIGNNAISVVQDYEQDTRKTTNDGESRGRIARHYRFCKFDVESITNPHPIGLLAQLVERCTGIAEVMGSNSVRAWIFSGPIFNY